MPTYRAALAAVALAAGLWAQTPQQPLTNADVESMLTAGLPESTILMKIGSAAERGLVDLDASPAALGALRQKGATEQELNAVVWAEPFGAVLKRMQEEDRAAPDLPRSPGIYFKGPSGWAAVPSFLFWAPFYSAETWFHRNHSSSVPLAGSHSELQINLAQPVFYVRSPASGEAWRIITLTSRDDRRLLRLVSSGDFAQTERFPPNQVRDVQIAHVAGDIFTVKPAGDLARGEYGLCTTAAGGPGLDVCYSFGIQR